ncbi:MAG: nucleotidyltransferase family protein [Alphaproteobacteria bacterium]|nr:nucleotidyltransferase family protein [Alphaproteobacteria bacterium]MBU1517030.1 nucleotidyltransferase family protein [Alphaproteobacteria bacterium]MBU2093649.1 nucleotidyltransferase family protein [Alphaproteobacteria bacterium]MBU2152505.1 nucleotidyltransferase family protein [Alphaproteobacteria bacterium]MBU2308751.1 nucleotidyltransferase family protein [Alphaproteobacteria bacterium]
MVLAAGIGSRMRPLTDTMPKALVPVAGIALIDRVLYRLADAGVERAVVNVHHFADQIEAHLAQRDDMEILISDERAGLLDSGGGIKHAADKLGRDPIFVANIDSLWVEGETPALEALKSAWDPAAMDILLLLVKRGQGIGFEGPQGFFRDEAGRLTHSTAATPPTPFANVGFAILKPDVLDGEPEGAFSIIPTWHRLQAAGRLYGTPMDGFWMHVGDPAARDAAEFEVLGEILAP